MRGVLYDHTSELEHARFLKCFYIDGDRDGYGRAEVLVSEGSGQWEGDQGVDLAVFIKGNFRGRSRVGTRAAAQGAPCSMWGKRTSFPGTVLK